MAAYTTRRGAARRKNPVGPQAMYDLPTRERPDDGAVILHVGDIAPTCSDCGRGTLRWAEAGYVPWHRICDACGSHWDLHPLGLGIAMIPVTEEPTCGREACIPVTECPEGHPLGEGGWCDPCGEEYVTSRPHPERTCYAGDPRRCAERAAGFRDEVEAVAAGVGDRLRCMCPCHVPPSERRVVGARPSRWEDGQGWVPIDPEAPIDPLADRYTGEPRGPARTWGGLLALVTDAHVATARAEQDRTMGVPCVPACWARRARFYGAR